MTQGAGSAKNEALRPPAPRDMLGDTRHQEPAHLPVLLDEVVAWLNPRPGGLYCDATVGMGGHARAVLERSAPDGRLVGLDRDPSGARDGARGAGAVRGPGDARPRAIFASQGRCSSGWGWCRWTGSWSTSGSRRRSSTARSGDSRFETTGRSTCGWIRPAGETRGRAAAPGGRGRARRASSGTSARSGHAARVARAIVESRRTGPLETTGPAGGPGRARAAAARAPQEPGHAHVSGAAHRRQPGARRAGARFSTSWPTAFGPVGGCA